MQDNAIILPSAVYSETHSPKLSDQYVHIKTSDVLSRFQDMGWEVSSANSAKHSKTPQFARHAIRMRHKDFPMLDADNVVPELIVLNSHNGSWALRMALGMFRMVCSNGMVAGSLWGGIALKHYRIKDLEEKVVEVTHKIDGLSQQLSESINFWSKVEVPLTEQQEFAQRAMAIRWGDRQPVTPDTLLESRRPQDLGNNLWKVFNRVQENLTQGGMMGRSASGANLKLPPVRNVKRDFKFNSQLWDLANEYAKEAA